MRQSSRFVESLEGRSLLDGTISGNVHNDVNGSGAVDENSLTPTTVVYLDSNRNGRHDRGERSTTTDTSGNYRFTGVPGGQYVVRIQLPKGWAPNNAAASTGTPVIFFGDQTVRIPQAMIRYRTSPWAAVGQNAQHDGISPFPGLNVTQSQEVTTQPSVGQTGDPDPGIKFGTPLFTKFNTAIVPVFIDGKFAVRAYNGTSGFTLWTFESDYVIPPTVTLSQEVAAAVFQPALDAQGRLYVPGAGGTVHLIGAPDQLGSLGGTPTNPTRTIGSQRLVFYGKENYPEPKKGLGQKAKRFNETLFINTGLTVGNDGSVYFGVDGMPKRGNVQRLGSSLVRLQRVGRSTWTSQEVLAGSTPALSADGAYLYVATQETVKKKTTPRLERFAAGSLARAGSVVLRDPSRPKKNRPYSLAEGAYAMPTVAPDGDVYYVVPGTRADQTDLGNGWLLRFSGDLSRQKMASLAAAGQTVSVVPADMVSGYGGRSSYVIAATYNTEKSGALLALLDPAQAAPKKQNNVAIMRTLKTIVTSDEWISRPVTVDPANKSIYAVNAQTQLVRWNVSDVTDIGGAVTLGNAQGGDLGGMSVVIGPDGLVYAIVQGNLYVAY